MCYSPQGRRESDTTEQLHFLSYFSLPSLPKADVGIAGMGASSLVTADHNTPEHKTKQSQLKVLWGDT